MSVVIETRSHTREETRPNKLWTYEIMTGAIVALKEFDQPVNPKFLQVNHTNLYDSIRDYPGGWRRIVRDAGYNPDQESRIHLRDKGYVPS